MKYLYLLLLFSNFTFGQTKVEYLKVKNENVYVFSFNNTYTYLSTGAEVLNFTQKGEIFSSNFSKDLPSLLTITFLQNEASIRDLYEKKLHKVLYDFIPKPDGIISTKTTETYVNGYPALSIERIIKIDNKDLFSLDYVILAPQRIILINISTLIKDTSLIDKYKKMSDYLFKPFIEQKLSI